MIRIPKRQRGQGMTEYIIIIAVIAILTLGIVVKFGDQIRELFVGAGTKLASGDDTPIGVQDHMADQEASKTIKSDW